MQAFPWYLVTGLILGVVFGLVYSMWIAPVTYYDTVPKSLNSDSKEQLRNWIALAYQADSDLNRAESRLIQLGDNDPISALGLQAQRVQASGTSPVEAQALAILSSALFQKAQAGPQVPTPSPIPSTENGTPQSSTPAARPTLTPLMTFTPRPTATMVPTQGAPFVLQDRQQVCNEYKMPALLMVEIKDASGKPVPNVTITVTWNSGQDQFVTGLYDEIDKGYADFQMSADIQYMVQAGEGGEVASGIQTPECTSSTGSSYWGGWLITFVQP
jgi:hypothetical protein